MVRPFTSSGLSGRIILNTSAAIEGTAKPHAIHIAASRSTPAIRLTFSGKSWLAAS